MGKEMVMVSTYMQVAYLAGKCIMFDFLDGSQFDGAWSNGTKHGYGILKYSDGERYEGYKPHIGNC